MGKKFMKPGSDALKRLIQYGWPGNVRELEHYIERAVILSEGGRMHFPALDDQMTAVNTSGEVAPVVPLADMERGYVEKILNATHWRVSGRNGAAAILGLKPTTLISRMKKLGITKPAATELLKQG
jgi:transcriptional regulator of acetoin/glycerol metabolism